MQVERIFSDLSIPDSGRKLVRSVLSNGPVRAPQAQRANAVTHFYSRKMNCRYELESRRGELAMAIILEDDESVIGYFPRPLTVDMQFCDANGVSRTRYPYTPDFLVIRGNAIELLETRDEEQLLRDSIRSNKISRDDAGNWRFKAAEDYFHAQGFGFRLISKSTIPATLVLNARFLEDYALETCPPLNEDVKTLLVTTLRQNRWMPFLRLVHEHNFSSDVIFRAILDKAIYVDIYSERLDVASDLVVCSDKPTYDAYKLARSEEIEAALPLPGSVHISSGATVTFDGKQFKVLLSGEREVCLRDENGHVRSVPLASLIQINGLNALASNSSEADQHIERKLADCSPRDLQNAMKRLNALKGGADSCYSERTISRYSAATALAKDQISALLALVDSTKDKGNRLPRLPFNVKELAQAVIKERYNQPETPSKKSSYGSYITACETKAAQEGLILVPMSYVTFCRRCDEFENVKARQGKRIAYQKRAIPLLLDQAYPVHGVRPHEVCYIDHTIATIATVSPEGVDLGKPTLSLAVDGHTTHPRAFIVTYDPPSARVVLLLLRDYVRRNGRLPKILVVDNGKEFHSKELKFFCDIYKIVLRFRPPAMPRAGSPVERALGATEEEVLAMMQGNTRQMRDPRLVTKSINPFGRAVWTLTALWGALDEYLFTIRPERIHPAIGMTPNQFEQSRYAQTGERAHTLIRFDENLMLMTCPHAKIPFHKVDKRRGVWTDGMYYWHPDMVTVRKGEKVEVRIEPWVANVIYVQLRGKWQIAIARNQRPYAGRTRRSVEVALREEQRRAKVDANKDTVSKHQMTKKERFWAPSTFDARIDAQQLEQAYLFGTLQMREAIPASQSKPSDSAVFQDETKAVQEVVETHGGQSDESCSSLHIEGAPQDFQPSTDKTLSLNKTGNSNNPLLEEIDGLF